MSDTYSVIICPKEKLDPYIPLIFSKWLRSFRYGNDMVRLIDAKSYYPAYHRYIDSILCREETEVRLAALTDDLDVVLGFSVSRGTILDYVHVQKDHRRQGIGRNLVPEDITTISHLTKTALTIWGSKFHHWKFDPFN